MGTPFRSDSVDFNYGGLYGLCGFKVIINSEALLCKMAEGATQTKGPQKEQSFNKSEKTKDVRMTNIQAAKGTIVF